MASPSMTSSCTSYGGRTPTSSAGSGSRAPSTSATSESLRSRSREGWTTRPKAGTVPEWGLSLKAHRKPQSLTGTVPRWEQSLENGRGGARLVGLLARADEPEIRRRQRGRGKRHRQAVGQERAEPNLDEVRERTEDQADDDRSNRDQQEHDDDQPEHAPAVSAHDLARAAERLAGRAAFDHDHRDHHRPD